MDSLSVVLDHMEPTTDAQKSLLADAKHNYEAIWQTQASVSCAWYPHVLKCVAVGRAETRRNE